MAFSWTPVTGGVTIALASHVNEVKTNTDALAAQLSIANYSWVEMPVSQGDPMLASQMQELQDALDYIDTNNVCSAENTVKYTTDNPAQNTGADSGQNSTVDADQHLGYNATQNTGVFNPNYTAVDNDQHNSYLNDQNTGYYVTQYTQVDSDQHATYYATRNSTIYSLLDNTYYASRNAAAK